MVRVYERILSGQGSLGDLSLLESACKNLLGRSFCGLGDGATSCVTSSLKYFRQDYLDYIEGHKPAPFDAAKIGAH
jgi:NADH-quinone oxidoreductase subunit F